MKYAKMLGLLAVAAAALMAFAGPASATLTSPAGTAVPVGTEIKAEAKHSELTGTINITCTHSTVAGKVSTNTAAHAVGTVSTLKFEGCGAHTVTAVKGGSLTINSKGETFSSGAEVTVLTHSIFLGTRHCIYVTQNTKVGTLKGGSPATLPVSSVPIPQSATDSLCGNDAVWHGSYTVTAPNPLFAS